jgi:dihydrofolate synthase/folylpolyglutamate synthase
MIPTYADVERSLLGRAPETQLAPSLERIRALCELLGDPQKAYPLVHLTGTNGKSSTSRMIDALLRARDLRTGRFTSPHLQSMRERISIDGELLTEEGFIDAFADVAAYAQIVDDTSAQTGGPALSFFEMTVAMAYAAFADAPVDAAVVEVGMGGAWDATNVATGAVAVITPIDIDHVSYLGDTAYAIAEEKAGIIKAASRVVSAAQSPDVLEVLARRAADVGAPMLVEGVDFAVANRAIAVGGQQFDVHTPDGIIEGIFLGLHGAHQAQNAACALVAAEAFAGPMHHDVIRDAFAVVTSPGRLEVARRSPTIVLDAAHNPHGLRAALAGIAEEFSFSPLVVVLGAMADKDVYAMLALLEPAAAHVVCTRNASDRSMRADELGEVAADLFGEDRVSVVERLDNAIDEASTLAETLEGNATGSAGVLVTGSVVTVGEARTLLGGTSQ